MYAYATFYNYLPAKSTLHIFTPCTDLLGALQEGIKIIHGRISTSAAELPFACKVDRQAGASWASCQVELQTLAGEAG